MSFNPSICSVLWSFNLDFEQYSARFQSFTFYWLFPLFLGIYVDFNMNTKFLICTIFPPPLYNWRFLFPNIGKERRYIKKIVFAHKNFHPESGSWSD